MSKELLDTLENRVFSAVDTIETLRSEVSGLKEERKILEDKLQELIEKIGNLDQKSAAHVTDDPAEPAATAAVSGADSGAESSIGFAPSIQAYKNQFAD